MVDHPLIQAQSSSQPSFLPKMTATKPSKEVSKESPKRISESSHRDGLHRASFDSASSFSEKPGKEKDDHAHQITCEKDGKAHEPASEIISHQSASQWQPAQQKQSQDHYHAPAGMTQRGASQAGQMMREGKRRASQRQAHLPWPNQARKGSATLPPPPDHLLARSFLNEIAVPFGDRNPKGSTTRILNILAQASLNETEVLLCLVRAYTIARDTRTIRSAHVEPGTGRANRMPLFCTLFERFVQARLHNDRWNYSWQQLEDNIAADDRLFSWWTEHQVLFDPQTLNLPGSQTEAGAIAQEEPDEERENDLDIGGWDHREAAHYWGEQLLEALIAGGYEAEVYVHLEGQRYQLLLAGDGGEWLLSTPKMVQDVIKKMKNANHKQQTDSSLS